MESHCVDLLPLIFLLVLCPLGLFMLFYVAIIYSINCSTVPLGEYTTPCNYGSAFFFII